MFVIIFAFNTMLFAGTPGQPRQLTPCEQCTREYAKCREEFVNVTEKIGHFQYAMKEDPDKVCRKKIKCDLEKLCAK
jgi:hypothetical protein